MKDPNVRRFADALASATDLFPGIFRQLTELHQARGSEKLGLDWPDWCFTPTDLATQLIDHYATARPGLYRHNPATRAALLEQLPAVVTALAAWKIGKYVYRFDPDLMTSLNGTSLNGPIPGSVFQRLPAWCVYIELPPGHTLGPPDEPQAYPVHGAWAYLDWTLEEKDPARRQRALKLILHVSPTEANFPVHLRLDCTLEESLRDYLTGSSGAPLNDQQRRGAARLEPLTRQLLGALLYLCAQNADYTPPPTPDARTVRRSVHENRVQPATQHVGWRVGAAIRAARPAEQRAGTPGGARTGRTVTPHLRGTHWQTYWTGPKTAPQVPVVKWKAPTLVGFDLSDAGDLPVVLKAVRPAGTPPTDPAGDRDPA